MRIGVLRVQGAFAEHEAVLRDIGAEAVPVRLPEHLADLAGLILPGGESTTITKLMKAYDLDTAITDFYRVAARSGVRAPEPSWSRPRLSATRSSRV